MPMWKKNLIVCWFGMFISSIGFSQIAPILPLYIKSLGVNSVSQVESLSGIAFGITFVSAAIFSPVWGIASDKFGRKPMLIRSSLGTGIIILSMAFVTNVYQFIGLRLLLGAVTGFATACTIMIATQTDKENAGWALAMLSTSSVSGTLFGPAIGGFLGDTFGFKFVFYVTGTLVIMAFLISLIFVKEDFVKPDKKPLTMKESWLLVPDKSVTLSMFLTYFILTLALFTVEPIITVYISTLTANTKNLALISGLAFSSSGFANILAAPKLGKLCDKFGAEKVIFYCLVGATLIFLPQAFVKNPFQLMELRFVLGIFVAGLNPTVNTIIKKITPSNLTGSIFGFNMFFGYLGVFAGALVGGEVSSVFGIRYVFFITSGLLLFNAIWVYFKVYKKINSNDFR